MAGVSSARTMIAAASGKLSGRVAPSASATWITRAFSSSPPSPSLASSSKRAAGNSGQAPLRAPASPSIAAGEIRSFRSFDSLISPAANRALLLLVQIPEDRLQDAAVLDVADLVRRIEPDRRLEADR